MAKRTKTIKPQKVIAEELPKEKLEAAAETGVASGRFANLVQCTIGPEDFCLDFFARMGTQAVLTARIFVTPTHAERIADLLRKQVVKHKEMTSHIRQATIDAVVKKVKR